MTVSTPNVIESRPVALGVVCAQPVLGVSAFKDVAAGMRNVFGGRSRSYENELSAGGGRDAPRVEQQAAGLSADAVLSVDIDHETVGTNMLMVSASSTAVRLT
jgi:uncharacterized protein YbjQ (UPF0145 family)